MGPQRCVSMHTQLSQGLGALPALRHRVQVAVNLSMSPHFGWSSFHLSWLAERSCQHFATNQPPCMGELISTDHGIDLFAIL